MGVIIPESDMEFGTYQEKQVFRIEESEQYTKEIFYSILKEMFPRVSVEMTRVNTNPIKYL